MTIKQWGKVDNSATQHKAQLRIRNLPKAPAVLDLFCGAGQMYRLAYRDRAVLYHGIDKEKIHDPAICTLGDNLKYLQKNDIDQFNVFDLDDYGSPWKQLYLILRKLNRSDATIFVTDGLVMRQKVNGKISKFVSATERVRRTANIPGLNRWYVDIFATMLLDVEKRYGWKTVKAEYFHNDRRSVYYWALKMEKLTAAGKSATSKSQKSPSSQRFPAGKTSKAAEKNKKATKAKKARDMGVSSDQEVPF